MRFQSLFPDPAPRKIGLREWHERFKALPEAILDETRYFQGEGKTSWNNYLQPPSTFSIYGLRVLHRLKFDNGLASLRLWGFLLNEGERLFRARQAGMKLVALMGDYGGLAPLVYSFPGLIPFYPDFQYWTPFLCESSVLLDTADGAGIGENCCFVRASLGAFLRGAYFPKPDLVIAVAGAACDDVNAVAQQVQDLGIPFLWTELPLRKSPRAWVRHLPFRKTGNGIPYPEGTRRILVEEYRRIGEALAELAGTPFDEGRLAETLKRVETGRQCIRRIRRLVLDSAPSPLPALELMQVEFAGTHFYSDLSEGIAVLEDVLDTVKRRASAGIGFGSPSASPVAWATPPADPILLDRLEDLGGRLAPRPDPPDTAPPRGPRGILSGRIPSGNFRAAGEAFVRGSPDPRGTGGGHLRNLRQLPLRFGDPDPSRRTLAVPAGPGIDLRRPGPRGPGFAESRAEPSRGVFGGASEKTGMSHLQGISSNGIGQTP
ncbi:MAG: 2-hydroxyacyl-CoA dehydratase family protein [Planctomycetota bacterium]|jgi:hypothetical protein